MKSRLKSSAHLSQVAPRLNASPKRFDRMNLTPRLPPGRANRKALAFAAEIRRLRETGYSFEAIRIALLEAGVKVSRTTVKREAAKWPAAAAAAAAATATTAPQRPAAQPSVPATPAVAREVVVAPRSFVGDARSGKEIADAFMKGRISNPLVQERMRDEGRSD